MINGCVMTAVVRSWQLLREAGAPSRLLAITFENGCGHAACVTEDAAGQLFLYDGERGSMHLVGLTLATSPLTIARAAFEKVGAAQWLNNPRTAKPNSSRDRRLSPREVRRRPLFMV